MGQKTNPIGNRLGIIRGWESNWYGGKNFGDMIAEDETIRKYIFTRLNKASVSRVIIERTLKLVTITITTAVVIVIVTSFNVLSMITLETLALFNLVKIYLRIVSSSAIISPKFFPPYQLDSHPLIIPNLLPIGFVFCPI